MEQPRPPRAYLAFLGVALLQFGLLVVVLHTHVKLPTAAIYALVLWRLARGGHIAWTLLLAVNVVLSLAALAIIGSGTGVAWGNVLLLVIPGLIMVSLLLSAPMRRHVGLSRSQPAH